MKDTDTRCLGYYIVQMIPKPDWSTVQSESILSLGDLCPKHPDFTKCYYTNYPKRVREAYARQLGLSETEFESFAEHVDRLIEHNLLALDGRFRRFEDAARNFSYYQKVDTAKLVGLCTTRRTISQLRHDGYFKSVEPAVLQDNGTIIGCEILGCETFGVNVHTFDSYLSNSLEQVISEQFFMKHDTVTGLILNTFNEVEKFTKCIQGMGEPVIWNPYQVVDYTNLVRERYQP